MFGFHEPSSDSYMTFRERVDFSIIMVIFGVLVSALVPLCSGFNLEENRLLIYYDLVQPLSRSSQPKYL